MNYESIKKKIDELKKQYELVQGDKFKIQNEINDLKNKVVEGSGSVAESYEW